MQGVKAPGIPIEEFLRPFFDAGETVCLRVFSDRKDAAFKGAKLECPAGRIGSMMETLKRHNAKNRGISLWSITAAMRTRILHPHSLWSAKA